jgi:hypothetical protein
MWIMICFAFTVISKAYLRFYGYMYQGRGISKFLCLRCTTKTPKQMKLRFETQCYCKKYLVSLKASFIMFSLKASLIMYIGFSFKRTSEGIVLWGFCSYWTSRLTMKDQWNKASPFPFHILLSSFEYINLCI